MRRAALPLFLAFAACLPQVGPHLDGGEEVPVTDAGNGPPPATCFDGQLNGNESDLDCGGACTPCAGVGACRSSLDCASGVCSTGKCAPPATACQASFASCTTFVDLTGDGVDRTIHFPLGNETYGPKCARVRFGQTVTFSGSDFSGHPLTQACGPVNNVVLARQGSSFSVTFDRGLGVYGYYCTQHGSVSGSGMSGAIEVVR
jgi:plastocyanin